MGQCEHNYPELAWLRSAHRRRIGLFGGSFNPLHAGHWQCAEGLRKALQLDQVWWLPSPTNPLKNADDLQGFAQRYRAVAARIQSHPAHRASRLMQQKNFIYTIDFIKFLQRSNRNSTLFWLAGSDILQELHRWKDWRALAHYCQPAFYSRPQHVMACTSTPAGHLLRKYPLIRGKRANIASRELRG